MKFPSIFSFSFRRQPVVINHYKTKKTDLEAKQAETRAALERYVASQRARAGNAQHDHFADKFSGALGGGA